MIIPICLLLFCACGQGNVNGTMSSLSEISSESAATVSSVNSTASSEQLASQISVTPEELDAISEKYLSESGYEAMGCWGDVNSFRDELIFRLDLQLDSKFHCSDKTDVVLAYYTLLDEVDWSDWDHRKIYNARIDKVILGDLKIGDEVTIGVYGIQGTGYGYLNAGTLPASTGDRCFGFLFRGHNDPNKAGKNTGIQDDYYDLGSAHAALVEEIGGKDRLIYLSDIQGGQWFTEKRLDDLLPDHNYTVVTLDSKADPNYPTMTAAIVDPEPIEQALAALYQDVISTVDFSYYGSAYGLPNSQVTTIN